MPISKDMAFDNEELDNFMRVLNENMLPNPFIKMSNYYQNWKTCEKRDDVSWDHYMKKMKKYRKKRRRNSDLDRRFLCGTMDVLQPRQMYKNKPRNVA